NLIGGVKRKRNSVMDFKVKVPKQFKKKWIGYVPDFSKADSSGRITFIRIGDGTVWQQIDRKLILEKDIEKVIPELWYRNLSNNEEFNLEDFQKDLKKNTKQSTEDGKLQFEFKPIKKNWVYFILSRCPIP
ncbi:unnamed protein product, partial [marine sediment metagenome]